MQPPTSRNQRIRIGSFGMEPPDMGPLGPDGLPRLSARERRSLAGPLLGGGFALLVVGGILVIFFLIVASAVRTNRYVDSHQAEQDALAYGCASGTAERAVCRTCTSADGVCCDLRCALKGGGATDVRLRCSPGGGCTLAPAAEVRVQTWGGSSTTSTTSSE